MSDGFTTGKAGGGLLPIGGAPVQAGSVPIAYTPDALELARSQRLAQLLSNPEVPQGQMISGRFVAPSWTQNLAQLAQAGTGAYFATKAEEQQQALAKKIREGENMAMADYISQMKGRPAEEGKPAIAGNTYLANLNAAQNDMLPSWMRQHAMKEVTKGPDWKQISQVNQKGETELWRYNENSDDPRSTLQYLGTSKYAFTPAEILDLNDRGIGTGQFGNPYGNAKGGTPAIGGAPSVGNAPTVGGAPRVGGNAPSVGTPAVGGNAPASMVKPTTATNVKEPDLVKAFGYDPFKPPPVPAGMPSGSAARAYRADQFKALEGEGGKKVNGAASYQDALDNYLKVLDSVSVADLANPQARKRIDSAYNTAILTGKNAFDLGVLNGGDERILNSLIPNYKDATELLTFKDTIKELVQAQKEYGTGIILKEYGRANKAVPEMYRKHIVVPKNLAEQSGQPLSFKTEAEAAKANLPKGTKVIINGVSGTWK